jgi:hypothetical protein
MLYVCPHAGVYRARAYIQGVSRRIIVFKIVSAYFSTISRPHLLQANANLLLGKSSRSARRYPPLEMSTSQTNVVVDVATTVIVTPDSREYHGR